jgi:hypothetical protein
MVARTLLTHASRPLSSAGPREQEELVAVNKAAWDYLLHIFSSTEMSQLLRALSTASQSESNLGFSNVSYEQDETLGDEAGWGEEDAIWEGSDGGSDRDDVLTEPSNDFSMTEGWSEADHKRMALLAQMAPAFQSYRSQADEDVAGAVDDDTAGAGSESAAPTAAAAMEAFALMRRECDRITERILGIVRLHAPEKVWRSTHAPHSRSTKTQTCTSTAAGRKTSQPPPPPRSPPPQFSL